ncbi:MAG: hypothetical protein HDR82_03635 [Bacteroides sp.]|nr:hypothetical protein [Bacteroides sp.]
MSEKISLKYTDDRDRCYGVAGMAMSMIILECDELLSAIDIDAPVEEMIKFTPQYFFAGNPRLSARLAWNQLLEHYRLTVSMLVSNVLSRHYVYRKKELTPELLELVHGYVTDEGRESCQLDEDEINSLFNKQFSYMQRLFRHHGVQSVIDDFAGNLLKSRHMSASEVLEGFSALRYL